MRLLRALLVSAAFSSAALAGGWFGVRADYHYGSGVELVAVVEQSLFSIGNAVEIVGGVELRTPSLEWQPYSAINLYTEALFAQLKWGTGWVSLQMTFRW